MPEEQMLTDGRTTKIASLSDGESDSGISSQSDSRHEFPPELEYRLDFSPRSVPLADWVNQQRLPSYSHAVQDYKGHSEDYERVLKRELGDEGNSSFTMGDVTNLESRDSFRNSRRKTMKVSGCGHLYSDNKNIEFIESLYMKQDARNDCIMKYVNPIYNNNDNDDCFALDLRQGHYCCTLNNSEMYTKETSFDIFSNKRGCGDKSRERKRSLEREENKMEIHYSRKSDYLMDEKPIDYSQLSSRWKEISDGNIKVELIRPIEDNLEHLSKQKAKYLPEASTNISKAITRPPVLTTNADCMLLPKINGLPEVSANRSRRITRSPVLTTNAECMLLPKVNNLTEAATNISNTKISSPLLATNVKTILSSQNNDFPKAAVNISNTIAGSPVLSTNVETVLSPNTGIPSSQRCAVLSGKATRNSDQTSSHAFVSQTCSKLENCGFPRSASAASNVTPHTYTAQETNTSDILVTKCKSSICNAMAGFKKTPNIYHRKLKYLTTVSRLQAKDLQQEKEYESSTENETAGYHPFCKKETFTSHDNHQTIIREPLNNCTTENSSKTVSYKNIHNITETTTMPAQDYVSTDSTYRSPLKFTKGAEQETIDSDQTNIISSLTHRISILHSLHRSLNKFSYPENPKQVAANSSKQSPKPNSLPQDIPASEEMQTLPNTKSGVEKHACIDCSKRYSTASNLARHRQIHQYVFDKKVRKCPYCEKTYVSTAAYTMHARTHVLGSECPFCGKHFSRPWLLQGHIRTHTGEKPFPCPQCGKPFADKSNLRAHIQTHATEKPYVCGRCRKAFALKSYLYKHESSSCMKTHRSKVMD